MYTFVVAFALIVFATFYLLSSSSQKPHVAQTTEHIPVTEPFPVETKKEVINQVQISQKEILTPLIVTPEPKEQEVPEPVVQAKVEEKPPKDDILKPKEHKDPVVESPKKDEVKTEEKTTEHVQEEAPDTINTGKEVPQSKEVDCAIVVAQYTFKARSDRELTIQVGDEVVVLIRNESGWFRGQNLTTKHLGWFPYNYCTPSGRTMKLPIEFTYPEAVEEALEEDVSQDQSQLKVASNKVQSKIAQIQQQLREQNTENPVFT